MEAAAVSAVVSVTLKVVGNKLTPLLIKEYTSIVGVKRDLEDLRDQVEEVNSWLETRYEAVWNDPSFNWLKRLKDAAYAVDDVVDEFQLKAEKHAAAADGGGIISKYVCTKPKSFIFQCKVASKIKKIKRRFDEIIKQRTDYNAITNCISVGPPLRQTNMNTGGTSSCPDVDVSSVIGRDEDKKHIISKLLETDHQLKIKIISVIGLGGSGKTTLSKLVFSDGNIKKHFDFTLWVHVSQKFDVSELVQKLFEAFADNNPGQHDMPSMRKKISEKLTGKRFLLVLDDVWTESQLQWEEFREFLINIGAPGSRILLTARSSKVAETVGSTDQFLLPLLSEASSWQLFIESCRMSANDLDSEFHDVGKQLVDTCGGVPLAIKVLAGVLRGKEQIDQWKAMRDNNLLYVEGKDHRVAACLRLSYFQLPSNLKQCFTICSLFPKGHRIDKKQLIDLWIAHDMINPEDGFDYLNMEYVGHNHFNSLVQMSFLQNVEEKDGRVTCGMHDLVHDLALSILDDKISLVVPKEATSSAKSCRYFSLTERAENLAPKFFFKKTRAVYIPRYGDTAYLKAMKHAKHLRSVMVGCVDGKEIDTISQVKYLKYLAMSPDCETLPKGFSDIWSLQALHVTQSHSLLELPKSIGKMKMLRTLNLSGCEKLKCLPESIGDCEMISSIDLCNCKNLTVVPGSIGNLSKLRSLNLSRCEKLTVLPNSIGRNEKLRVLRLCFTKIERLPSDITTIRNLECLDLQNCHELVELPEGIGKLEKLQVLTLNGCDKLGGMPVGIGRLNILQRLGLFVVGKGEKFASISELSNISRIEELTITRISHVMDPNEAHMVCLKEKTNLKRLDLNWMSNNMEEVNTKLQQDVLDGLEPPHRIEKLEINCYFGRHYAQWMQNQVGGVQEPSPFPLLRVMRLCHFPNLKHLDGLVELPCLEELNLEWMNSLESISGGPFPSLVRLTMTGLPCLGEVWMAAERTMPDEEGGCCYSFTAQLGQVWVGNCLTELSVSYCSKLEVKPQFPPSLQLLDMHGSEQLLQSPGQCQGSSSPPNFKQLKKLELSNVTELENGWELLQNMTALDSLKISLFCGVGNDVPESLGSLTSLRSLEVSWSSIRMLPESLGKLRSLQELTIKNCDRLISLPQSIGQLTSLQELVITECEALQQLPDCLGGLCSLGKLRIEHLAKLTCLPESICRLTTSLQELEIKECQGLTSLAQGIEGLASLEKLSISKCVGLTSLPQGIEGLTSLERLTIMDCTGLTSLPLGMKGLVSLEDLLVCSCPGIQFLPEGIKGLTALKKLQILGCPDLKRRCEREKGEDWHLISHIADVWVV